MHLHLKLYVCGTMSSKGLFFLCFIICNYAKAEEISDYTKIVGGEEVKNLADFPYQVSLRRFESLFHFCGGILLTADHILTAAHCMFSGSELLEAHELLAVTGSLVISPLAPSALTTKVKYIFVHEKYDPEGYDNDIAILRLNTNLTLNEHTKNISLSTSTILTGEQCTVSGWGSMRENGVGSNKLMSVKVPVVSHQICREAYNPILTNNMLCAGIIGKDSCQGDSGGPLKCKDVIAGIVSFGSGCGQSGYPGVYADVSKYQEWIKTQLARASGLSIKTHNVIFALITLISLMHANMFL